MTAVIALAAAAVGYLLGRVRLWARMADWAAWQIQAGGNWYTGGKTRQALLLTAWALTAPKDTLHAWRHRHEPPQPLSPPVELGPARKTSGDSQGES